MTNLFYRSLMVLSKWFGIWIFILASRVVAAVFFILFPSRAFNSVRFYGALYPDKNRWFHIQCAWKQYCHFTYVFLDRFLLHELNGITHSSEGFEYLDEIKNTRGGGILLMSHLGNWEIAAQLLREQGFRLLLYMGRKHKEQLEGMQKESLVQTGITIVAVDSDARSPFHIIDGIKHLKSGGIVSMTGDRIWSAHQRTVPADFLGHEIALPETPYVLSLLTQSPLYIFFAFRTGHGHYHISISPPVHLKPLSRKNRVEVIRNAAQTYANAVEAAVRKHPFEWFHFDTFLGRRL